MLSQRLNCILYLCASESPFNRTLPWHLSGPLCLRITRLALNQHQRVQSPLKVKSFQRELLLHVPCGMVLAFSVEMLAGNIVKEGRTHFNNGLPFEPHQNHICVFNDLCVAKQALQDTIVCLYIRKCLFFVTYIKAVQFFFSKTLRSFNDNFPGCVAQCHVETL